MNMASLAAAAAEHEQALDAAEQALKQAQAGLEQAGEKHKEIARLVTGDLPAFADWVSGHGALQLNQLRARLRLLRSDSARFRATIANKIDRARRTRRGS